MSVTWTKLEEFTGTRTRSLADPDNEGEIIEVTMPCRDIEVEFTDGTITHRRLVNVCFDSEGNYDAEATDDRLDQHARGVANKIAIGLFTAPAD